MHLKAGAYIPDEDHVVRHVKWGQLEKDCDDNVLGILPQAFVLRATEESLSFNWLEYFDGSREDQLTNIKSDLSTRLNVGSKSFFCIGNVKNIKDKGKEFGATSIRIAYAPTHGNKSHVALFRLPDEDLKLLEALASDVFVERIQAQDLP